MKPIDVKLDSYAESNIISKEKDPIFQLGNHVRISKQKNSFVEDWLENIFVISKIKQKFPWTYVISDLNDKETTGTFYEKNCRRLIKKNLEQKK